MLSLLKKEASIIILLLILIIALPITIFLVKQRQDIRPKAEADLPSLSLIAPETIVLLKNQKFDVKLFLDPKNKSISGFEVHLSYPDNLVEIDSQPTIDTNFPTILQNQAENGNIDLAAGISLNQPTTDINTPLIVATLHFKVKSDIPSTAKEVSINFKQQPESIVTEKNNNTNVLGQTKNIILSLAEETNVPRIKFKVKFRPVNKDIGQQTVKLKIKQDAISKEYNDLSLKHTTDGVYISDEINLIGITAGEAKIFVKGPKHLAKGFPVNLVAGNNPVFDWTNEELEPGDLPPQDGKINALDISRLIELLSVEKPNNEQLSVGDLNYDGAINGGDTNELILTLSTKYDEDKY